MRRAVLLSISVLWAVSGLAHARETLTVYTYESFIADWGPGPQVKAGFEKGCGCTVEWVALPDAVAILNRLKLEGSATKADVVLGLDNNIAAEAKALGLFAAHGLDANAHSVPGWSDDTFLPFDYGYFAVVYDSQALKAPPRSLEDLVNGPPDEKIVLEDPRTSTPGLGFLLWMKAVYGDRAGDAWQKLKARVLTVTPGWSEAYGLFTKGEAPMVLSYTTSPAYHLVEEKTDRYKAAAFVEGHYLQIEVAGMTATSDLPALARRFLGFMMEPGFQDLIATKNWMFPAGRTSKPLPEAFATLVVPSKTLQFAPEDVAANRRAWTEEWLNAMGK